MQSPQTQRLNPCSAARSPGTSVLWLVHFARSSTIKAPSRQWWSRPWQGCKSRQVSKSVWQEDSRGWEFLVPQMGQRSRPRETSVLGPGTHAVQGGWPRCQSQGATQAHIPSRTTPHSASSALPIWPPSHPQPLLQPHPSLQPHRATVRVSSAPHEVPQPSLPPETPSPVQVHPSPLATGRAAGLGCSHKRAPLPGRCRNF